MNVMRENCPFRALPLTCSTPAASEIVHQRDMLVAAVKRVYGYSETDLFHNRATTEGRNLPGKSYRDIKQNWELKRKRMTQGRHSIGKSISIGLKLVQDCNSETCCTVCFQVMKRSSCSRPE